MTKDIYGIFNDIVRGGVFADGGMSSFSDVVSEDDVKAIKEYLIDEQQHRYAAQKDDKLKAGGL